MAKAPTTAAALPLADVPEHIEFKSQGYFQSAWRRLRRNVLAMVCLAVLAVITATAIGADLLTDHVIQHDPNRGRLLARFQGPSSDHWLGTDDFGRDTLARLIHAGRVSLTIGFVVAAVSLSIGVTLGLLAGFYGRYVDDAINGLIQIWNNIPTLFLLIMLSVLFRPSVLGLAFLFGLTGWESIARLVRGRVLTERRRDYVDAALVAGASDLRIMFRHVLPNVTSIVLVVAGFQIGGAIIAEAGLSAIGFGVQIPTASWGNMLAKALENFDRGWWLVVAPGVMITITVFCIYVFADALRDALDPRLKER